MNAHLSKPAIVLLTAFLFLTLPLSLFVVGAEESDGKDGAEIFASAGGSGELAWNDIHAFSIFEDGDKIDDPFNVTVSENIKYDKDTGDAEPTGHIFGTLTEIRWDDDPVPTITISNDDFEDFKDDQNNLTVFVLGEYYNESQADPNQRHRWAWKTVTITKPNNPPVAVPWVAVEGKWEWFNLSQENDVTFIVESGNEITLIFDASRSWDPDEDAVTEWRWDLNEDGTFGGVGESGQNLSRTLTEGKTYNLGLMVGDSRDKYSTILNFKIRIQSPERLPDLIVEEITYENMNKNKENYEVGDVLILRPKIKNDGENDTTASFKAFIEYSRDNGQTWSQLTVVTVDKVIKSGQFELISYNWDTGSFSHGQYRIRVTADHENVIREEDETNNHLMTNLIPLEEKTGSGSVELSFEYVIPDKTKIKVNEPINVNISVKNDGDGEANYVDIHFDIGGVDVYFLSIDLIAAGANATLTFPFTGDAPGTFVLGFRIKDDGLWVGERSTTSIVVEKETVGPGNGGGNDDIDEEDDSGFLPGFEIAGTLGAVTAGALLFLRKRR